MCSLIRCTLSNLINVAPFPPTATSMLPRARLNKQCCERSFIAYDEPCCACRESELQEELRKFGNWRSRILLYHENWSKIENTVRIGPKYITRYETSCRNVCMIRVLVVTTIADEESVGLGWVAPGSPPRLRWVAGCVTAALCTRCCSKKIGT